jgi:hypothetical protein
MTYKGTIQGGAVVLEPGVELPEGLEVRVGVGPAGDADGLLEEPSLEDAVDKLHLLYKIRRGIQQADAGQTVSLAEARKQLAKWLE